MALSPNRRVPPSAQPLVERDRFVPGIPGPEADAPMDVSALGALESAEIVSQPDGSAIVRELSVTAASQGAFDENLAERMDESDLQAISTDLSEKIKRDRDARSKRDEQYEEGLKRSGLGKEAPGGAMFTGASKVVHPMLAEACVDFESAAIKELFPSEGPAKPRIFGEPEQKKLELAERQQRCLNWQLTKWVPEYVADLERVLTQVPMGGSQFMKFWIEPSIGRWTCEAVYIDDLYIPYSCADFWQAARVTHVQRLTESQVEDRIDSGMYRDVGGLGQVGFSDESKAEKASDKIEGRERIEPNVDNERPIFECSTYYRLKGVDGGKRLPYLISIDDLSGKVLSIYRNWEEDDVLQKKLHWIVEWSFIPWRGAYAIGFPHLIGGLSAAATGALRALLDSAHANNTPGGLILKGYGISGQTVQGQPGLFSEVAGSNLTSDDIRKVAMAYPFNPPSTVLFQLLGWLTDAAKGVVTTSEEKIADATNSMPVGTALALIESGAKVYSAIHKRLHRSQQRAFEIIARLCSSIPNFEEIQLEELGEVLASPQDFAKSLAVQPASDPEVFSDSQRMARVQILELQASKYPQVYNLYAVQKRVLTTARIPDVDEVLPPPAKPTPLNAAAENAAASTGRPLVAFPDQAHLAHIMTHMLFMDNQLLGEQGIGGPALIANMAEHLKQHITFQYVVLVRMIASEAAGKPIDSFMKQAEENPQLSAQIDQAIAAAAPRAQQMLMQQLGPMIQPLMGIFAKAAEMKKASQIPHPDAVAAASLVDEATRKTAESAATLDLKEQDQMKKAEQKDRQIALDERKFEVDTAFKAQDAENERQRDALMLEEVRQPGNQVPGI